jgi:hypothetical protein
MVVNLKQEHSSVASWSVSVERVATSATITPQIIQEFAGGSRTKADQEFQKTYVDLANKPSYNPYSY